MEWRAFLNVDKLPSLEGRLVKDVVFVTGKLPSIEAVPRLYAELIGKCRAFPFLLASDGNVVLVGFLATGLEIAGTADPVTGRFQSVYSTLCQYLTEMELVREPAPYFRSHRFHRYESALAESGR